MWSNSLWEQEHQEELYQAFMEECLSGGPENFVSPVRQIVCGGCGRLFYTRVHSRNTATTTAPGRDSGGTSGSGGWKSGGIPCARPAAAFSRPNAPTLPIAATPVAKRHTGRALRAMVSDQNDLSARIVTASKKQSGSRKRVLIR